MSDHDKIDGERRTTAQYIEAKLDELERYKAALRRAMEALRDIRGGDRSHAINLEVEITVRDIAKILEGE